MARDNRHDLRDQELMASIAFAAAGATANTPSIDLGYDDPNQRRVDFPDLVVKTTDATGVTDKDIDITLQDSADNVTFAAIVGLAPIKITAAANVYGAIEQRFKLPPTVRRYIRASAATEAAGGAAGDGSIELSLRF